MHSLALLIDVTCAHTRQQIRNKTYSIVEIDAVNTLQRQFDSLIDKICIKITDDNAAFISSLAQNLIRTELASLLQRNQEFVKKMTTLIECFEKD